MPQQVFVDSKNNVSVRDSGPVGPRGIPGPSGGAYVSGQVIDLTETEGSEMGVILEHDFTDFPYSTAVVMLNPMVALKPILPDQADRSDFTIICINNVGPGMIGIAIDGVDGLLVRDTDESGIFTTTGYASCTYKPLGDSSDHGESNNWVVHTSYSGADHWIDLAEKGVPDGVVPLESDGLISATYMPAYVDDVISVADYAALGGVLAMTNKIYITEDTEKTYRWSGTVFAEISASLVLGSSSATAHRGDHGAAAYTHSQLTTGNPHNVTKADVGLSAVTNDAQVKKTEVPVVLMIAVSDEATAISTGTAKVTFRMPHAMTLNEVRASVNTASSSGNPTFDINMGGTSVLHATNKLSIDASEKTSQTVTTATSIVTSALTDDAEITIDVDTAGTGAKGAKITLIGTRSV